MREVHAEIPGKVKTTYVLERGFEMFQNKGCILVGEVEECERFYCSFHNDFNIQHIVLDHESTIRLEQMDSLYVKYSDIEQNLEDYYVIICRHTCVGNPDWDDILYRKGLYFKQDYIDSQYFLMKKRKEKEDILRKKNIWIFGAGDNGEQFLKSYSGEYHICGFVSNYKYEVQKCGLPVVRIDELEKEKNVFIVICSIYEMDMYAQLIQMGMQVEIEFTFSCFFPKKFFAGVGTCQVYYCVNMLLNNRNFSSKYYCMTFGENSVEYASMAYRLRLKEYLEFCDVLFYQTADSQARVSLDYTTLFRKCGNALKISMPFYYFKGIHQQMDVAWKGTKKYSVFDLEGVFSNAIVYRYKMDREICRLMDEGMECHQIYSKILSDNYFSKEEIVKQFHASVRVVKFLDKFSDIKIASFITKYYKKFPVFTDTEHMGPELQIYIANELAGKMKIDRIDQETADRLIYSFHGWWPYYLYIYPSVAKGLELEYWHRDMKYKKTPLADEEELQLKEYVFRQIEFMEKVNALWHWMRSKRKREDE